MARLQLIFPLLFWVLWLGTRDEASPPVFSPVVGTCVYIGGLVGVVALVTVQSMIAMRRTSLDRTTPVPRFHRTVFFARWFTLGWHATALWTFGFGDFVLQHVPSFGNQFHSLPTFASVVPVVVTWVGLIAAQYPLERGVREQNALYAVEFGEPVRPVPTRFAYVSHAVRSQVLFTLAPLLAIAFVRDGMAAGIGISGYAETLAYKISTMLHASGANDWQTTPAEAAQIVATVIAAAVVFVLAPELLRRVLPTKPLEPSPARDRLEAFARDKKLGVRDILVWDTHHTMGNAAVMGIVPGIRYVLITDLLLESMPAQELEAVFAHEAGHVAHRHMAWYLVYFIAMTYALDKTDKLGTPWLMSHLDFGEGTAQAFISVLGIAVALGLFGLLSRQFERQADAFASRRNDEPWPTREGAAVFASALRHVARINNMPMDARSMTAGRPLLGRLFGWLAHQAATWLHGSIRSRIDHVARLADEPASAGRFERTMALLRFGLLAGLIASVLAYVRLG